MKKDYIVMADQEKMMADVTEHVKNWAEKYDVVVLSVETFYNRTLGAGVVKCITSFPLTEFDIEPIIYTTGVYVSDIIFR
jgi:hypothetical protein